MRLAKECDALRVAPGHYAMVYQVQSSADSGECPILYIFYLVIVSRLYLLWQTGKRLQMD
jgi:hypothetical protein